VAGLGGLGGSDNRGVELFRAGAVIRSIDGAITISGEGGRDSDRSHIGVALFHGAEIESSGTGCQGTSFSRGIAITGDSAITSVDGNIQIDGTGGRGTGDANSGVLISTGGRVESTGMLTNAATITISGTGGAAHRQSRGVAITSTNSHVSSIDGNIAIISSGGTGTGSSNQGVFIFNGAAVRSLGAGSAAGLITITGTGGSGSADETGVVIDGTGALVEAEAGQIEIQGWAGAGTSESLDRVRISNQAIVQSTGTGSSAATITITGTGGDGTRFNDGVEIGAAGGSVTSVDGDIRIQGTGGTGPDGFSHGVNLSNNGSVTSTGSGADAATITVMGAGGAGGIAHRGVTLSEAGSTISSIEGDISLTGTGGGGTNSHHVGVGLHLGARVESTGTGSNAATITINGTGGTGGTGSSFNRGVGIFNANSLVTSVDGDIVTNGTGGNAAGGVNVGVQLSDGGGQVTSTGTTVDAATITITGTAVAGDQFNRGVSFNDAGAGVSTIAGDVSITVCTSSTARSSSRQGREPERVQFESREPAAVESI
jgi:hypothetical protein